MTAYYTGIDGAKYPKPVYPELTAAKKREIRDKAAKWIPGQIGLPLNLPPPVKNKGPRYAKTPRKIYRQKEILPGLWHIFSRRGKWNKDGGQYWIYENILIKDWPKDKEHEIASWIKDARKYNWPKPDPSPYLASFMTDKQKKQLENWK